MRGESGKRRTGPAGRPCPPPAPSLVRKRPLVSLLIAPLFMFVQKQGLFIHLTFFLIRDISKPVPPFTVPSIQVTSADVYRVLPTLQKLSSEDKPRSRRSWPPWRGAVWQDRQGIHGAGVPGHPRSTPSGSETGSLKVMPGFPFPRMRFCVILTCLQIINPQVKKSYPSASEEIEIRVLKRSNCCVELKAS